MTSILARSFQRSAADQAVRGWVGDPLKLPFARILQEMRRIHLSDAYRCWSSPEPVPSRLAATKPCIWKAAD